METRREDGNLYPPSTLYSLLSGINHVMQSNKVPFSVLDRSNVHFRELLNTLDTLSSQLHKDGVGVTRHSAPVITPEHEELFWEKGLLGYSSPKVLQHTVFFYMGLNFVLRGIQGQHDLVQSQLERVPADVDVYNDSVYYRYIEFISKNNQHRFKDINSANKEVCSFAQPGRDRCLVKLLDMYLKYLPSGSTALYLRPLAKFPSGTKKVCFSKQKVGVNTLRQIVPDILCRLSGCSAKYTNHSLRATAITRMFNSGMSEKVIAETSGHRSMKGLRYYEHTSTEQKKAVTKVVNNPGVRSHDDGDVHVPVLTTSDSSSGNVPTTSATSSGFGINGTFSNCTFNIAK